MSLACSTQQLHMLPLTVYNNAACVKKSMQITSCILQIVLFTQYYVFCILMLVSSYFSFRLLINISLSEYTTIFKSILSVMGTQVFLCLLVLGYCKVCIKKHACSWVSLFTSMWVSKGHALEWNRNHCYCLPVIVFLFFPCWAQDRIALSDTL